MHADADEFQGDQMANEKNETTKRDDDARVVPHPRVSDIRGYGKSIDTDAAEADEYRNG